MDPISQVHAPRIRPSLREELFLRGPKSLSTIDLLAILLGTGTRQLGVRELSLQLLGERGLASTCFRDPAELRARFGVGDAKAARVLAALELGVRATRDVDQREPIVSLSEVERWAAPRLSQLEHEELWLLCLDAKNGLKAEVEVARGGALGCSLTPADVLRPAVRNGASALVLVHNHPSGDPTPSRDDVAMTRTLARACRVVGIPLLDHVVVARGGARSTIETIEPRMQINK
jgi:DNA repair protein RadC